MMDNALLAICAPSCQLGCPLTVCIAKAAACFGSSRLLAIKPSTSIASAKIGLPPKRTATSAARSNTAACQAQQRYGCLLPLCVFLVAHPKLCIESGNACQSKPSLLRFPSGSVRGVLCSQSSESTQQQICQSHHRRSQDHIYQAEADHRGNE